MQARDLFILGLDTIDHSKNRAFKTKHSKIDNIGWSKINWI